MLHKNKFEDFVLQLLKEKLISLCGLHPVKITGTQVFFIPRKDQN